MPPPVCACSEKIPLAAQQAVHFIGMPEGALALAQAVVYLAVAPKSNALYAGYGRAARDARETEREAVPLHLRNAPTGLMKGLGYGKGYQYAHNLEDKVADMDCLPDSLKGRQYYHAQESGEEAEVKRRPDEVARKKKRPKRKPED